MWQRSTCVVRALRAGGGSLDGAEQRGRASCILSTTLCTSSLCLILTAQTLSLENPLRLLGLRQIII